MVRMHVDIGVLRGAQRCHNIHGSKPRLGVGGRPRPMPTSCSLIESELYTLSTAGAIAFTACTAAPGQLGTLLRAPASALNSSDSLLWTGITVLSALPFCGWMVWPGLGLLRARLDSVPSFPKHYGAFAALYALPLVRSACVGGVDELALISVFFCVLHVQAERMLAPALTVPGGAAGATALVVAQEPLTEQQQPEAEDFVAKADADAISGWDQRWALRSMSVSQLLALSRDFGIRGRSRMSKRQLLEALEAVGAHETLQPEQHSERGQ